MIPRNITRAIPVTISASDPDAWQGAPCSTADPDVSFAGDGASSERAHRAGKAICAGCHLAAPCLELALKAERRASADGRYGVFGGLDPRERAALARERGEAQERRTGVVRKRRISVETIPHGTVRGYQQHRTLEHAACRACSDAVRVDQRERRAAKRATA